MSNPNSMRPIDITPDDDNLSAEEAERLRAETQPRGHESLEDFTKLQQLEEEERKLRAMLEAEGITLEEVEDPDEDTKPIKLKGLDPDKATGVNGDTPQRRREYNEYLNNIDVPEKAPDPNELGKDVKKSKGAKIKVSAIVAAAASVVLAGAITIGSVLISDTGKNATPPAEPAPITITVESDLVDDTEEDDTVDIGEREASGIIDGYGEEGMWLSDGKTGPYAFADFEKVVEMHDGDAKEAIKDVASKQVESMADCISGMSDQIRPAGYQGLSMAEVDEKIENLSDVEYDLLKQEFEGIIDRAEVKEVTLNGKYDNAYMGVKDGGDKIIGSKEANEKDVTVNHETMQLMKCTTNEKGSKAYELSWKDDNGKTIASETIKEACTQVVEKEGSNPIRFKGLPEATEKAITGGGPMTIVITGGGPTIVPPPEETPPKEKKWGKSGDPHTGNDYKQTKVTDPAPDNSNINNGNQGYVDDMGAAPGAASEWNGVNENTGFAESGIVADGASTEGQRLEGGENQSGGDMAGDNAYQSPADTSAGEARDEGGNQDQEKAQESSDVGGDNNSDRAEEAAVAGGNF